MALSFSDNTPAEIAAQFWDRLRRIYMEAQGSPVGSKARRDLMVEFSRMIWKLHGHVVAGDFTNNDVRLSFNAAYGRSLNSPQWNSFVTDTLLPIRDHYQAMLDQEDL